MGEFIMKKLLLFMLMVVMMFSLAACGTETTEPAEPVALVDVTTDLGFSLKLPSDLLKQSEILYSNLETGDSVSFGVSEVVEPLAESSAEDVLAIFSSKYEEVKVTSFENGVDINGKESLVSSVTTKTPQGNDVTIVLVIVTDNQYYYVISFVHGSNDTEGSLVKNLDACIDSIIIN